MAPTYLPPQDLRAIYARLTSHLESTGRESMMLALLQDLVALTNALGAAFLVKEAEGYAYGPRLFSRDLVETVPDLKGVIVERARQAATEPLALIEPMTDDSGLMLVAVGFGTAARGREALVLIARPGHQGIEPVAAIAQLAVGFVDHFDSRRERGEVDREAGTVAALLELVARIEAAEDRDDAVALVVNELRDLVGADRVALGSHFRTRTCRLDAISGSSGFDRRSRVTHALESVFAESVATARAVAWRRDAPVDGALAHAQLARAVGAAGIVSVPLITYDERTVGVLVGWWHEDDAPESARRTLEAAAIPVAAVLDSLARRRPGALTRAYRGLFASLRGYRGVLAVALAGACLVALSWPVTHRVSAAVQVEPRLSRVVAAPFDGIVESVHVRTGDEVEQGRLLVTLDGSDMRDRLDGLEAEIERLRRRRDIHMAEGRIGEAGLDALEIERVSLDIGLLERRLDNLELRSPIDGVVTQTELERRVGGPATLGQALVEVAPLGRLVAHIEVPVDDIAWVEEGMPVRWRLDAVPGRQWAGQLTTLAPRAEVRDGEGVFVAELPFDGENLARPGMTGSARLEGERRALGWVLFHKPWERLMASISDTAPTGETSRR